MKRSYKFQLLPTSSQVEKLEKIDEILTEFYNSIVEQSDSYYQETGKTLKYSVIEKQITTIKSNTSSEDFYIHSHLYQVISKRFKRTRENSFRVFRETGKYNPPKKKKTVKSFGFKQRNNGWKLISNNRIKFNDMVIKFNKHREILGEVLSPIIKKEKDGKYYLILICEVSKEEAKSLFQENKKDNSLGIYSDTLKKLYAQKASEHIGIDLGIKKFITSSDGYVFENPKFYKEFIGSILKYQKILDNKLKLNKGKKSKRYEKVLILMNKKFRKLVNKRDDYLHKIARYLLNTYKSIAIEDLRVSDMMINKEEDKKSFLKKLLHKELSNVAFTKFINILTLKSENCNTIVTKVDPKNTSKQCSKCGEMVEKDLKIRTHFCEKCGLIIDRDLNASINIFMKAWNEPSPSSSA